MENNWMKKKAFYMQYGLNGSLKGSKGQREEEKLDLHCIYEKNGKKGPAVRYREIERFEQPKERIHGNTGREPINKGAVDKNALKYKLAEALIATSGVTNKNSFPDLPKKSMLELVGFSHKTENQKHFENDFSKMKLEDMDKLERLVLKIANNNNKSLSILFHNALDLIRRDIFPGVTLHEDYYYADFQHEHNQLAELDEYSEIIRLYDNAKDEAKQIVKDTYGDKLFFFQKAAYENQVYTEDLMADEKYELLWKHRIHYIYKRYTIHKPEHNAGNHDFEAIDFDEWEDDETGHEQVSTFDLEFRKHRRECSSELAKKELNKGLFGIINTWKLPMFAEEMSDLLFYNDTQENYEIEYNRLVDDVRTIVATGFGK